MEQLITFGFGILLTIVFGILYLLKRIKDLESEIEEVSGEYEDLTETFESFVSVLKDKWLKYIKISKLF